MLHDILKDFPGSQDGSVTEQFKAGEQRELSDYLAACVVPYGWAKPVAQPAEAVVQPQTQQELEVGKQSEEQAGKQPEVEKKAIVTDDAQTSRKKRT